MVDASRPWDSWKELLHNGGYVASDEVALMASLAYHLGKPLLLEGPAGSGKTALALAVGRALERPLIRLNCYEGLGASHALYDWNYHLQWVAMQREEDQNVFDRRFLLARPLLKAVEQPRSVLLIDEIDRADEAFEALLLEYLAEFQVTVPEWGTIRAATPPFTVLTSNRQRPLSDALRRRCIYLYLNWPDSDRENAIVAMTVPNLSASVRQSMVRAVGCMRQWGLVKPPGLAETLDWAKAAAFMGVTDWQEPWVRQTLGLVIKDVLDEDVVRSRLSELIDVAHP
jgi:MoxR-like ATPase